MNLSPRRYGVKTRERRGKPGKQPRKALEMEAAKKAKTLRRDHRNRTTPRVSPSGSMSKKPPKPPRELTGKHDIHIEIFGPCGFGQDGGGSKNVLQLSSQHGRQHQ